MIIGEKIKKAIDASNLTQEQVAAHAEMSMANLYKIYKRDSVESRYLVKIAEILGVPVDHFLYDVGDQGSNQKIQGIGNAGRDIHNQKIMPESKGAEDTRTYGIDIEKMRFELELCKSQKASLEKEVGLKDQIISLLQKNQ